MSSSSDKCTNCAKLCIDGQNCIQCDKCDCWQHLKCSGLKLKEFKKVVKRQNSSAYFAPTTPVESVQNLFIIPKMP